MADEYSGFVAVKDDKGEVHLNGKLTLGENTADNGGTEAGVYGHEQATEGRREQKTDGFTAAQRFFIGFAQVWCENVTPQRARELALIDPHSPGRYRVIGTIQNADQFAPAFGCKKGDTDGSGQRLPRLVVSLNGNNKRPASDRGPRSFSRWRPIPYFPMASPGA